MSPEIYQQENLDPSNQVIIINGDWMSYEEDERILSRIEGIDLFHVSCGLEFLEVFGALRSRPPRLVMGEVNLALMEPMPNPPRVLSQIEQGCYDQPNTVGLRCLQMVAEDEATCEVPLVLSTLFDKRELETLPSGLKVPAKAKIISKLDFNYESLLLKTVGGILAK